jgi:diguanylate cyclase (GGDEF)-like protein/PAS domain S-box-containing protein
MADGGLTSPDVSPENDSHASELAARRTAAILRGVTDAIGIIDRSGRVTYLNPAACDMLGHDPTGEVIEYFSTYAHEDDWPRAVVRFVESLTQPGVPIPVELRMRSAVSGWHHLEGTFVNRADDPAVDGVILTLSDVTERRQNEERLIRMALRDPLTDLPNRVLLMERLSHALARGTRGRGLPAVLFFDLDRFKMLNDTLGHAYGDRVLLAVSQRVRPLLRDGDTLARLGGDEFAVLCEEVAHAGEAAVVGHRILSAFDSPFDVNGTDVYISTSIGVAVAEGPRTDPDQLLADADAAMYQAKDKGRGRCEIFDVELRAQLNRRMEVERGLREALANDELEVHYQPIFTADGGTTIGVEALVRWRRHGEMIIPADFIGVAEESGLIMGIDDFVLKAACRQMVEWDSSGFAGMKLGVNLSARYLANPSLTTEIGAVLEATGLAPSRLQLEVTESAVMADLSSALRALRALREIGVSVSVDDFGTGFSSLSYLRELPVDMLKIDRSFVAPLGDELRDRAVVQAIVDLAHSLGLQTVGEGVETSAQLETLERMGCDYAQGYHLFRPAPASEIPALAGATS